MITCPTKYYSELITFKTFEERFNYLKLDGRVGEDTFGAYAKRWMNQNFYKSHDWHMIKNQILIRDNGCDLGLEDYPLENSRIYIHHMNPITPEDIINRTEFLLNPEFLICVSFETHNALHYGDINVSRYGKNPAVRFPGDQCPWL